MNEVERAVGEVLLGASIASLHESYLLSRLGVEAGEDFARALNRMDPEDRRRLREDVARHVGAVCRWLGERHAGDPRICHVLEEWVRQSKDYEAFDALVSHFDFPARGRLLDEGLRLFPSTLTAHWRRAPLR